jgi:hypothetical protein
MSLGPIELLVIKFPGNQFRGEIAPALLELVDSGIIRVIELIVVSRDADGTIGMADISEIGNGQINAIVADAREFLSDEDLEIIGASLEPNSTAGVMLFENTWATRFADAVRNANGQVVVNERVPRQVIEELVAAIAAR